ncbi:MAG: orotate phosphoribosyltransferase [Chloroflexota bacterium]
MSMDVEKTFEESGAVLRGHFLLTSGRHSPVYWEKFRVLQSPRHTVELCRLVAERFRNDGVQVVAGPTLGGVILAFEVARQLQVRSAYAEKDDSGRTFRRGLSIKPGERVLIVDDVLTTGTSVKDVIQAVQRSGGHIVGIGVLVDRSEETVDLGLPLFSCLRSPAVSYPPDNCPLCQQGLPLTRPGGL